MSRDSEAFRDDRLSRDDSELGRVAVRSQFLTRSQWEEACARSRTDGVPVEQSLLKSGLLSKSQVGMLRDIVGRLSSSTVPPGDGQPAAPPAPKAPAVKLQRPRQVGRYELGERLGAGRGGRVFRALGPPGPVAVKLFSAAPDMPAVEACLEDARRYAELQHPSLVPILDAGRSGPWGWIVMPLETATPAVDRVSSDGPLGVPLSVRVAAGAARGLAAAHRAGLLHLDIKPDNLLLTDRGHVRVLDFGLGWGSVETRLGTPSYMAPERCLGAAGDARSDIYSLGVTLYFLLTGRRPYPATTTEEAVVWHLKGNVEFPPSARTGDIPRPLTELVLAMTAREPDRRPKDMDSVARRLELEFPLFAVPPEY